MYSPFELPSRRWAVAFLFALVCAAPVQAQRTGSRTSPTSLHLTLSAGPAEVVQDPVTGRVAIREQDADPRKQSLAQTGSPDLAFRVVNVLLPPDARLSTVRMSVPAMQERQIGAIGVGPVGREVAYDLDQDIEIDANEGLKLDRFGRNRKIYRRDALWPAQPVQILETGQVGRFRYVRLQFAPFQWNPVTQALVSLDQVDISLRWMSGQASPPVVSLPLMELGFDEVQCLWSYLLDGKISTLADYNYLIITTQMTQGFSSELANFEQHKRDLGLSVLTVTMEAIRPLFPRVDPANSIRAFLQTVYWKWGPTYLLLIGDPDPLDVTDAADVVGSVPMKMLWPGGAGVSDENYPTDFYFSELTGEFDADGDGWPGEYADDGSQIESGCELLVGRIPFDDISAVDAALRRTIDYENDSAQRPGYRDEAILACSFLDAKTDGAFLGDQIRAELLEPASVEASTFYQAASTIPSTGLLTDDVLPYEWRTRRPGLVLWMGHGSGSGTSVGYDDNWDGNLIRNTDAASLPVGGPSFSIQLSCSNGKPEKSDNMAHSLLREHSVGTVAASRLSYYIIGKTQYGDAADIGSIGYWLAAAFLDGQPAGRGLVLTRWALVPTTIGRFKNHLTHNHYGDPALAFVY